jgi:protein phosphatase
VLRDAVLYVANVGDSRAYLLRDGRPTLLTRDHSLAAALCEQGKIPAAAIRTHHLRNHLTMVLGSSEPLEPACSVHALQPGDQIVLCSDGLWDMLEDAEIASLCRQAATPYAATQALIAAANQAGGADNITVIVLAIQPPASEAGKFDTQRESR